MRRSGAADEALCGAVGGAALWTRLASTLGARCRGRTLPPTKYPDPGPNPDPAPQPQPEPTLPGEQWGGGEGGGGEGGGGEGGGKGGGEGGGGDGGPGGSSERVARGAASWMQAMLGNTFAEEEGRSDASMPRRA